MSIVRNAVACTLCICFLKVYTSHHAACCAHTVFKKAQLCVKSQHISNAPRTQYHSLNKHTLAVRHSRCQPTHISATDPCPQSLCVLLRRMAGGCGQSGHLRHGHWAPQELHQDVRYVRVKSRLCLYAFSKKGLVLQVVPSMWLAWDFNRIHTAAVPCKSTI